MKEWEEKYWIIPEEIFPQNMNTTNWETTYSANGGEFPVQYNDWKNPRMGAEQFIWSIIGQDWLLKYKNENRDSYFTSPTEPSVKASNVMFLVSLLNILVAIILQATQVGGTSSLNAVTWYGLTIFHEIVYIPILVVWMMQAFGSYDQIITFVNLFDLSVYATTYGIPFWEGMIFLFMWFLPVFGVDTGFNG